MSSAPDFAAPFADLCRADPVLAEALRADASAARVPAGGFICMEGDYCQALPLVVDGSARVYAQSPEGRAVTLYRIAPGESCILTASCLLSGERFPAFAVAETDVAARMVRPADVLGWMETSAAWRDFVLRLLARRLAAVIGKVEDVTLRSLDARLAGYLLREHRDGRVGATHEQIATDLGSARAVVSRHLKAFEQQGWVRLGRGEVTVLDADRLAALRQTAR